MTRKERLIYNAGVNVIWNDGDELFWIFDGEDQWFLSFYKNNDDTTMVDEFRLDDTTDFDPEMFDFANGVPDYTETEDTFWQKTEK